MKQLTIVRHAKSSWEAGILNDYDRVLNTRGHEEAKTMSGLLKQKNIIPQYLISSTAIRAFTTATYFSTALDIDIADIEKQTAQAFDRVTVYRTLQTFVEKGIIHNIPTTDNSILYALCKHDCEAGHHHDNHVHFICDVCTKTICLDDVTIPEVKLPRGFKPKHAEMVVSGVCDDCK